MQLMENHAIQNVRPLVYKPEHRCKQSGRIKLLYLAAWVSLGISFTTNGRKSVSDAFDLCYYAAQYQIPLSHCEKPGLIMTLSTEAVIAIIGVIVSLPPAVVALRKLMRSKEANATALSCSHSPHSERRLLSILTLAQIALVQHPKSYQTLSLVLPP